MLNLKAYIMKKLLLIIMLCVISAFAYSDNYVYCELLGSGKLFSTKINVQADLGQKTSFWKGVGYLKDDKGKLIEFNSMVDAMNYFGKQGWEFVQAYVVTTGNENVYHWLLKKKVTEQELDEIVNSK